MPLIKSISGIRGTLENIPGESLSDYDVKQFTLAYLEEIILYESSKTILVGRDARKSGKRISNIIIDVVLNEGYNVIDLGLVTTPTIGIAVKKHKTAGAIMISASHNDEKWNALKLLNSNGEFLHPEEVQKVIKETKRTQSNKEKPGNLSSYANALDDHINLILSQNFINKNNIASKSIAVAVDGINSVGGVAIPKLLESLGIKKIKKINCNPDGNFNHNPEPLPENITDLCSEVKRGKYQLGIVVDPDADRLVLVDERGEPFGEEYTLVAAAEYLLSKNHGASTCSNLSSTLALKNITEKYGGKYFSSAVGEINVVQVMKEKKCLIGGEGNGGVIYPMTHYGRDSLIGIGLIISLLVERNISLSELKKELPEYNIFKTKLIYKGEISSIISDVKKLYDESLIDTTDGVKINFSNSWIHIRKSNTEPVIRIISEASSMLEAEKICKEIMSKLRIV
ncbi:MAG: phosphoglucosamine mutase [Bacteroidota bacterium]|nr:phosphoglucosamine mutase [Bacteroidota bacterium]